MSTIGIIYSPGYGAGWSTWNDESLALDQTLAHLIKEHGAASDEVKDYVNLVYPEVYTGGLSDCEVDWVEKGTRFQIREYDGDESIVYSVDGWSIAE